MSPLMHSYRFDPSYGYSLADLLAVGAPDEPEDFDQFWQERYARATNGEWTLCPLGLVL